MLRAVKERLTYANVMATLAVFIALGGGAYAALQVGSKEIRNNSVRSVDVRNGTLAGRDMRRNGLGGGAVKESSLGKVPTAAAADRVGGRLGGAAQGEVPGGDGGESERLCGGGGVGAD